MTELPKVLKEIIKNHIGQKLPVSYVIEEAFEILQKAGWHQARSDGKCTECFQRGFDDAVEQLRKEGWKDAEWIQKHDLETMKQVKIFTKKQMEDAMIQQGWQSPEMIKQKSATVVKDMTPFMSTSNKLYLMRTLNEVFGLEEKSHE